MFSKFRAEFERVKKYEEHPHEIRILLRHKKTGMLFFYEFFEEVNFDGSEDDIYDLFIKVNNEHEGDEIFQKSKMEIPFKDYTCITIVNNEANILNDDGTIGELFHHFSEII